MVDFGKMGKQAQKLRENKISKQKLGAPTVPIDQIYSVEQVRYDFKNLEEFAADIADRGILQPITVCLGEAPDSYEILYGERRWRAAQMANLTHVPINLVPRPTSKSQRVSAQLAENIHRNDLTPFEIAIALNTLKKENKFTLLELSKYVSMSRKWISLHLALLRGPDELNDLITSGKIGDVDSAHALVMIHEGAPETAANIVSRLENGESITRAELRALAKDIKTGGTEEADPDAITPESAKPSAGQAVASKASSGAASEQEEQPARPTPVPRQTGDDVSHARRDEGLVAPKPIAPPIATDEDQELWKPRELNDIKLTVAVEYHGYQDEGELMLDHEDPDPTMCWVRTNDDVELRLPAQYVRITRLS